MYKNPYQIFGVDCDIEPYSLRRMLLDYKASAMALSTLYSTYFNKIGPVAKRGNQNERVEQLLSQRYKFGLDFSQIPLTADEMGEFFRVIRKSNAEAAKQNRELRAYRAPEEIVEMKDMYMLSVFYVGDLQRKIEQAITAFDDDTNDPKDTSKMMDVLLSIKLDEIKAGIARVIAKRISENGIICSEEEFKETLMSSTPYNQINKIYGQIATKEKRDELIPEIYVANNMANPHNFITISEERVSRIVEREHAYVQEFFNDIVSRFEGDGKDEPSLENQNHDYAWGIVLTPPRILIDNDTVDTPIFKGKIKVEKLGSFTEKSLFMKNKYSREVDLTRRSRANLKREQGLFSRLKMQRARNEKEPKTMREYFYRHEAKKSLVDNIWRVTKTGIDGRANTYIIFTPLEYPGNRGSELYDFVKNIYLSDYMLNIAMQNGGYAGKIIREEDGFSVSNKYEEEEISTAILFKNGQQGDILDCREAGKKKRYENNNMHDFMDLISSRKRGERSKDE